MAEWWLRSKTADAGFSQPLCCTKRSLKPKISRICPILTKKRPKPFCDQADISDQIVSQLDLFEALGRRSLLGSALRAGTDPLRWVAEDAHLRPQPGGMIVP